MRTSGNDDTWRFIEHAHPRASALLPGRRRSASLRLMAELKSVDWKVVLLAVLGCYVAPLFLLGIVGGAFTQSDAGTSVKGWPALWLGVLWATLFLALPLLAGYVTAKYASHRPHLHVLLVALVGVVLIFLASRGAPALRVAFSVASLAIAALGAFMFLRRKRLQK